MKFEEGLGDNKKLLVDYLVVNPRQWNVLAPMSSKRETGIGRGKKRDVFAYIGENQLCRKDRIIRYKEQPH